MADPVVEVATEKEVPVEEKPVEETPTPDPAEPKAEEEKKPEEIKTEEPVKKNHDQRRWERTLKERAEYKAKAEWLEQQLQQKQAPADKEGRPARDQYQSDEDYVDALTTWKVDQKLSGVKAELAQHQTRSQTQTEWASKITQARAEYADYDTVMEDAQDIPISPDVAEAIQSSDLGGDIAYYLAKNPEEALRINSLTPMAAAREIGRIESYVEYEKTQSKKVVPVSKAPSPIKPVKSSSTASGTKSLEDMSPSEYMAYMNKRETERRKRH
jgi:hypothetical protein